MPSTIDDAFNLQIAGEDMILLGDRALFWSARRRLIIADLHLGKSHSFRRAGIAVPSGATGDDLARLDCLVTATTARELWILGDVLHGPASPAGWRDAWMQWRREHAQIDVAALLGNHDRALDGAGLGLRQLGETRRDGPFIFRHLPQPDAQGGHVIAGHLHPKFRLPGVSRSWPVFWLRPGMTVLPAFSEFTGGYLVRSDCGDVLAVCVDGGVVPVTRPAG